MRDWLLRDVARRGGHLSRLTLILVGLILVIVGALLSTKDPLAATIAAVALWATIFASSVLDHRRAKR